MVRKDQLNPYQRKIIEMVVENKLDIMAVITRVATGFYKDKQTNTDSHYTLNSPIYITKTDIAWAAMVVTNIIQMFFLLKK